MTLRTLNYGNYGIFLIMGNAGFCPSAVLVHFQGFGNLQTLWLAGLSSVEGPETYPFLVGSL